MKDLIDDLITILETAQNASTISSKKIFKGLQDAPAQAANTEYPYIMIDDGGEFTELTSPDSTRAQNRVYNIVLEMGTYSFNIEQALDDILNLVDEVKTVLEAESSRLKDGFIWGVEITPFGWEEENSFFRGRQVIMSYMELEDTIDRY